MKVSNPQYRDKKWFDNFWKSNPTAFGYPNDTLVKLIANTGDTKRLHPRVFEVGYGNGRYINTLLQNRYNYEGCDLSLTAKQITLKKFKDRNIYLHQKDFLSCKTNEVYYDLVFSSGYLEEITPSAQLKALNKVRSMVAQHGYVLLKYCIEIENRGVQTLPGFVRSTFDSSLWKVLFSDEELDFREYKKGVKNENRIKTGVFFAQKL